MYRRFGAQLEQPRGALSFVMCICRLDLSERRGLTFCESVFCFLSRFNSYPCFVVGDFQEEPEQISAVAQAMVFLYLV